MSGYDDPYAWERTESYLAGVRGDSKPRETCRECGERIINRGAHAERCVGSRPHGRCECPPSWKHEPTCPEVVGYPPAVRGPGGEKEDA